LPEGEVHTFSCIWQLFFKSATDVMSQPIKTNLCDDTFDRELQSNFAVFTLLCVLIDIQQSLMTLNANQL
jgi:hypothetical protein